MSSNHARKKKEAAGSHDEEVPIHVEGVRETIVISIVISIIVGATHNNLENSPNHKIHHYEARHARSGLFGLRKATGHTDNFDRIKTSAPISTTSSF